MSGVSFRFDLNATAAAGPLAGLRRMYADLTPVLDDIGAEFETSTVLRFDTNVDPDGKAWPVSLRAKEKGGKTLVQDGHLRDSAHYRVVGSHAVEIGAGGFAGAYAAVHQTGATITAKGQALHFRLATGAFVTAKSVKIPKRSYLGVSRDDETATYEILRDHHQAALAAGAGAP